MYKWRLFYYYANSRHEDLDFQTDHHTIDVSMENPDIQKAFKEKGIKFGPYCKPQITGIIPLNYENKLTHTKLYDVVIG